MTEAIPIGEFERKHKRTQRVEKAEESDSRPPEFSDEALALKFAEIYSEKLHYVAAWGRWLFWTGTKWQLDETLLAFDFVRKICREAAAAKLSDLKIAAALASAKTSAAMEKLARADRRLAATVNQWDADPWLLNTPGGVVDLKTGKLRPHNPSDYMTKITAVIPSPGCPRWLSFLEQVTNGDLEFQKFLQRAVGYALTGDTSAHALFFLFGTGANGKSVFIDTISGMIADYHRAAPIETFTASSGDRHPTDLAGLRGARLVTSVETEEGRRWAESRIKQLTGGDKVSARLMRQDFFEFTPQFKLIIAGNHKPGLRSVDEAMRRRFHLLPFTVTIPKEERDTQLKEKLKSEWPGILAWAIEGCLDWQAKGLSAPEAVTKATAAYLEAEDAIAAWMEDCCLADPQQGWETSAALFASWKAWAEKSGEYVGSSKAFSAKLEARGFTSLRKNKARGYAGYSLNVKNTFTDWSDQ